MPSPSSASARVASASAARAEGLRGGLPVLQVALADSQVEVRGAVQRLQFRQLRVGGGGRFVIAHLVMDVAQGGVERRIALARFDGLAQHLGGAFQLAFQVQGDGLGKRAAGPLELLGFLDGSHGRRHGRGGPGFWFGHDLHDSVLPFRKFWPLEGRREFSRASRAP